MAKKKATAKRKPRRQYKKQTGAAQAREAFATINPDTLRTMTVADFKKDHGQIVSDTAWYALRRKYLQTLKPGGNGSTDAVDAAIAELGLFKKQVDRFGGVARCQYLLKQLEKLGA